MVLGQSAFRQTELPGTLRDHGGTGEGATNGGFRNNGKREIEERVTVWFVIFFVPVISCSLVAARSIISMTLSAQ